MQVFAKMATKYAKLSKKAVCGKNGQKNMQQAKMQNYAKGSLWEKCLQNMPN